MRAASLEVPLLSTVFGEQNLAELPDNPTGVFIGKIDSVELVVGAGGLMPPSEATVARGEADAGPSDCPASLLVKKVDTFEHVEFAGGLLHPRFAAICGVQNRAEVSDNPSFLRANKMDRTEGIAAAAKLTFPVRAAIVGMHDEPAFADGPPVFIGGKIDAPDAVPDIGIKFVPRLSAVVTHRHCAPLTDSNCTVRIGKLDILQVIRCRAAVHRPCRACIFGVQNRAIPTDCPRFFAGSPLHRCEIIFSAAIN